MALAISFPRYNFVNSGADADCSIDSAACLPLSDPANLKFQMRLSGFSNNYVSGLFNSRLYLSPADIGTGCGMQDWIPGDPGMHPATVAHLPLIRATHFDLGVDSGANYADVQFDTKEHDFSDLTSLNNYFLHSINIGDCFKFMIVWDILDVDGVTVIERSYFGCTNCFKRADIADCFLSVISYKKEDDAFDFKYSLFAPDTENRVELPFYLNAPAMVNDQKVYQRSDGKEIKLYERKEEQYVLETDMMPYAWHKALDIALSHDTVSIINGTLTAYDSFNTATQFVKKENYEIEYGPVALTLMGKGKCKLTNATPVHLYNNNCN